MTRAELEAEVEGILELLSAETDSFAREIITDNLISIYNAGIAACDAKLAERHNYYDRSAIRALRIEPQGGD